VIITFTHKYGSTETPKHAILKINVDSGESHVAYSVDSISIMKTVYLQLPKDDSSDLLLLGGCKFFTKEDDYVFCIPSFYTRKGSGDMS